MKSHGFNMVGPLMPISGLVIRPKFIWKDADEIYINSGVYHHNGTIEQFVYWNSQLTIQLIDSTSADWCYLYLDDSAVVSLNTNLLTANEFIWGTTEPSWSNTKQGQYNGEDRCIFAVRTDGSGNILEFFHNNTRIVFADEIEDRAFAALSNTWTDVTLTLPKFCIEADVHFGDAYSNVDAHLFWRTNGQSSSSGHTACHSNAQGGLSDNTLPVITDENHIIEIKHNVAGTNGANVFTNAWYFPVGM